MTLGITQKIHPMNERKREKIGSIRHVLKVALFSLAGYQIFTLLSENNNLKVSETKATYYFYVISYIHHL